MASFSVLRICCGALFHTWDSYAHICDVFLTLEDMQAIFHIRIHNMCQYSCSDCVGLFNLSGLSW